MGTRTKTVRDGQPAHSVRLICVLCYNCQSGYQMAGCWGCSRQAYVNTDRPPLPLAPGRALSVRHGRVPCGTEEPRLPSLVPALHASALGAGTHA